MAYNEAHNIVPVTIKKEKKQTIAEIIGAAKRKKSKHELPDFGSMTLNADGIIDILMEDINDWFAN